MFNFEIKCEDTWISYLMQQETKLSLG